MQETALISLSASQLPATNGPAYPTRSLAWSGPAILDACCVQADYGHLLLLTEHGSLYGVNLDTDASVALGRVDLTDIAPHKDSPSFVPPIFRMHASADGNHAAIVVDEGQFGLVVAVHSGTVTMRLDGGDYCNDTVLFSACFLRYEGRNVLIHRTEWNRLDAADPATGASLSDRFIGAHEDAANPPAHHLDYFHGQLQPSPNGSRIFDDGWVWHPISVPRTWSVTDWLGSNPWESEDGASIVDLPMRDQWTTPVCWISNQHIALVCLPDWDEDEDEDKKQQDGQGPGIRILDARSEAQAPDAHWPMDVDEKSILDLFSDGQRLYVATGMGTTVWDIASRAQLAQLPGFVARLHDPNNARLVACGPFTIAECKLPWPDTDYAAI